jgi:hypothetical protein
MFSPIRILATLSAAAALMVGKKTSYVCPPVAHFTDSSTAYLNGPINELEVNYVGGYSTGANKTHFLSAFFTKSTGTIVCEYGNSNRDTLTAASFNVTSKAGITVDDENDPNWNPPGATEILCDGNDNGCLDSNNCEFFSDTLRDIQPEQGHEYDEGRYSMDTPKLGR